ncbi:hypothetical protein [Motilimonas sp. KMU-193]|uniref:hypothetical protein n=1 Tax=Motilimonas sp. KMU-193 TaxID=3388668 RepID=UPI00396B17E1
MSSSHLLRSNIILPDGSTSEYESQQSFAPLVSEYYLHHSPILDLYNKLGERETNKFKPSYTEHCPLVSEGYEQYQAKIFKPAAYMRHFGQVEFLATKQFTQALQETPLDQPKINRLVMLLRNVTEIFCLLAQAEKQKAKIELTFYGD